MNNQKRAELLAKVVRNHTITRKGGIDYTELCKQFENNLSKNGEQEKIQTL